MSVVLASFASKRGATAAKPIASARALVCPCGVLGLVFLVRAWVKALAALAASLGGKWATTAPKAAASSFPAELKPAVLVRAWVRNAVAAAASLGSKWTA